MKRRGKSSFTKIVGWIIILELTILLYILYKSHSLPFISTWKEVVDFNHREKPQEYIKEKEIFNGITVLYNGEEELITRNDYQNINLYDKPQEGAIEFGFKVDVKNDLNKNENENSEIIDVYIVPHTHLDAVRFISLNKYYFYYFFNIITKIKLI